jgi:hypothetical protein
MIYEITGKEAERRFDFVYFIYVSKNYFLVFVNLCF